MSITIRKFEWEIIRSLIQKKSAFPSNYPTVGRRWFLVMILAQCRPSSSEEYDPEPVKQMCRDYRDTAKSLVIDRMNDIVGKDPAKKWNRNRQKRIMAQIAYGILGSYPLFIFDPSMAALFRFIVERRYFSIVYMTCSVPKKFEYPEPTRLLFTRFNDLVKSYWSGLTTYSEVVNVFSDPSIIQAAVDNGWANSPTETYYPYILSDEGKANPVAAVEKLFQYNSAGLESKYTYCDCATATTCCHLGGLLAAYDKEKLFEHLSLEPNYLMIDHVLRPVRIIEDEFTMGVFAELVSNCVNGNNVEAEVENPSTARPINSNYAEWVETQSLTAQAFQIFKESHREKIEITHVYKFTPGNTGELRIKNLVNSYSNGAIIKPRNVINDMVNDKALFSIEQIDDHLIMTGDQVYIANHPLYRVFTPGGEWSGEFAFIIDTYKGHNPLKKSRFNLRVSGHGIEDDKVSDLMNEMLDEVNSGLQLSRKVVRIALNWIDDLRSGSVSADFNDVPEDVKFEYLDFPEGTTLEFCEKVVNNLADGKNVYIGLVRDKAQSDYSTIDEVIFFRIADDIEHLLPVWIVKRTQPGAPSRMQNYFVVYFDDEGTKQHYSLFNLPGSSRNRKVWKKRTLVPADLQHKIFSGRTNRTGTIVICPKVSSDERYVSYLSDSGAIEPGQ
jgi:hypothetical protein